jgi:kynurenine 3-monooxygenase
MDFNYSIDFGEYGYIELEIPPAEDGSYRHEKEAFHFWPRNSVMMAGLPNIDNNFTIGLFMKYTGPNSFEYFADKPDEFE